MTSSLPPKRTLLLSEEQEAALQDAALEGPRRPALIVMSGQKVGARLRVNGNVAIGRDPESGLCLRAPGVSFHHACIEDRGGAWVLVDVGSTNGTFVNGQRTSDGPLQPGDKLRFGQTLVRFEIQDQSDEAFAEAVSHLLAVDDLTGLYLRRRFDTELEVLVGWAGNEHRALSLLVMDLDGIKGINDRNGHLFGAYTISEAGKLIGTLVTPPAIACRFGGDEYIVALPDHDLDRATAVAETIRSAIASHPFAYDGIALRPGISIGVATFPAHGKTGEALFRAADAALYEAKRNGKNRVEQALRATGA